MIIVTFLLIISGAGILPRSLGSQKLEITSSTRTCLQSESRSTNLMLIEGIELGLLMGAIPTIAMMLASALLAHIKVGPKIEAGFQYFSAGLIVAVVASELFPLMKEGSKQQAMLGTSIGFVVGWSLLHGIERLVNYFEAIWSKPATPSAVNSNSSVIATSEQNKSKTNGHSHAHSNGNGHGSDSNLSKPHSNGHEHTNGHHHDSDSTEVDHPKSNGHPVPVAIKQRVVLSPMAMTYPKGWVPEPEISPYSSTSITGMFSFHHKHIKLPQDDRDEEISYRKPHRDEWDAECIEDSVRAFSTESHRKHILEHMVEVSVLIAQMQRNSDALMNVNHSSALETITSRSKTILKRHITKQSLELDIAERLDEEVHQLQYKLDHIRRLIQGSEVEEVKSKTQGFSVAWITQQRKQDMKTHLQSLKQTITKAISVKSEDTFLRNEILPSLEQQLSELHSVMESATMKWRRKDDDDDNNSVDSISTTSSSGSRSSSGYLPISFMIAVAIDCLVDGFLIGVSCALAPKAGIVVGAANSLEMASLGMAYATRISRCHRVSLWQRSLALYLPPLLMFLNSGFGAFVGVSAKKLPIVYISLVAIGAVALLSLVFNELVIEAYESMDEAEKEGQTIEGSESQNSCSWWYQQWTKCIIRAMFFVGIWVILCFSKLELLS